MQGRIEKSPRQERIDKINSLIQVIGYYTGIFQHKEKLGRMVLEGARIFYLDPVGGKVYASGKLGWQNFSGNESQKKLIIAFKDFVLNRGEPIERRYFENAIKHEKLNAVIIAADNAGIVEG